MKFRLSASEQGCCISVLHGSALLKLACVFALSTFLVSCGGGSGDSSAGSSSNSAGDEEQAGNSGSDSAEEQTLDMSDNGSDNEQSADNSDNDQIGPEGPDEFSDEFSVNSLADWTIRHQLEGEAPLHSLLDINQSTPGSLTIVPTLTPGWFANGKAPLIFKPVSGNFSVETSVMTQSANDAGLPPGSDFNAAGLMARVARVNGDFGENHIMLNVGRQNGTIIDSLGSETKDTIDSVSALELLSGSHNGRLTLCRIGNDFHAYRWLDNESEWTLVRSIARDDFPQTLQVGMIVNGFSGPDILAAFDYIRLRTPANQSDCIVP